MKVKRFRNPDLLAQCGIIQQLVVSDPPRRFDGDTTDHYHVRCIQCGNVDGAWDASSPFAEALPKRLRGYKVLGRRLEFLGICSGCRGRRVEKGVAHG